MARFFSLLLFLLLSQTASFANPQAMIILDASGSMWGQLEGRDKISLAKEALIDSVSSWNANVRLGLIAFGHRSLATCKGSEIIVPLGSPDESRALSKLQSLNPMSKGSIGHALRMAAKALDNTNEKATVILISDGQDACQSAPCDVAQSLEELGLDFTAHVIGLDVHGKSKKLLQCIAHKSGGKYLSATNVASLKAAIISLANTINTDRARKKNLHITASEKENSGDIEASHKIYKVVNAKVSKNPIVKCYSHQNKACTRYLNIGDYLVRTSYKGMSKETPLSIHNRGMISLHVSLNETAQVEIIARDKKGGKRLKTEYTLYKIHDGRSDKKATARCSSDRDDSCFGRIATGVYLVRSQTGTIVRESVIDVVSGRLNSVNVYMGELGKVEISSRAGSSQVKTLHTIYKKGKNRSFTSCYSDGHSPCIKSLPSGEYRVLSEYNKLKKESFFELKGSETNRLRMFFSSTDN